MKATWKKFRSYSGLVIKGTESFEPPKERAAFHVDRAFWLTSKVETGARFGSCVAYDGTAMTAGLDQHIAVYPKELANEDYNAKDDQGSLWKLLRRLEVIQDVPFGSFAPALTALFDRLKEYFWYVSQDGVLRYTHPIEVKVGKKRVPVTPGDLVFGQDIRNSMTPPGGKVPRTGHDRDKAEVWIQAFHAVFGHSATFQAQADFGAEHLVKRTKRRQINVGSKQRPYWRGLDTLPGYLNREISALQVDADGWTEELDLAMSVYQSHSVNAPAIANRALARARLESNRTFPRRLIELLGNSTYGRWDDDLKTGRYQRTRSAAMSSGLWSKSLFTGPKAIMPADLPG